MDDIIVFSNTLNDHVLHVRNVIGKLNQHGLRLNTEKCHFGYTRVLLLGHMLSGDTRAMDPAKAASALDCVKPTTSTQIEAFLGFVNYLRDYIPLCAELCAPLDVLRHVKGTFTLDPVQTGAFDTLVQCSSEARAGENCVAASFGSPRTSFSAAAV